MSSWLLSIALSTTLVAQVDRSDTDLQSLEIRAAIKELGSSESSARKQAYQFLWEQGLAAARVPSARARRGPTQSPWRGSAGLEPSPGRPAGRTHAS